MRELQVRMPKFSMAQEEGQLLAWLKSEGDEINAGDTLCEVATDKVNMEVESPYSGTLLKLVVSADEAVPVGEVIAIVATEADDLLEGLLDGPVGDADAEPAEGPNDDVQPPSSETPRPPNERPHPPSRKAGRPAMPGVRRRAAELGVNLESVRGTGRQNAITMTDIERATAYANAAAPSPESAEPAPSPSARSPEPSVSVPSRTPAAQSEVVDPQFADALEGRRRAIRTVVAKRMTQSATVPQFTVFVDVDLEEIEAHRSGVGWTTLWVHALSTALRREPQLNVLFGNDGPKTQQHVGVSVAADTPIGLLAPVVRDADQTNLPELDGHVRDMVARARNGRLAPSDLDGGTVTLSNLGSFDVDFFQALVTPPQVAVLSVGAITHRAVVLHGGIAARLQCRVGLTVDHRVADGADAARLLQRLSQIMRGGGN